MTWRARIGKIKTDGFQGRWVSIKCGKLVKHEPTCGGDLPSYYIDQGKFEAPGWELDAEGSWRLVRFNVYQGARYPKPSPKTLATLPGIRPIRLPALFVCPRCGQPSELAKEDLADVVRDSV